MLGLNHEDAVSREHYVIDLGCPVEIRNGDVVEQVAPGPAGESAERATYKRLPRVLARLRAGRLRQQHAGASNGDAEDEREGHREHGAESKHL